MKQQLTREALVAKDACDPLCKYRDAFLITDGMIYLDGNSLGMLPHACAVRARQVVEEEWGRTLISSWNEHGWIDLPLRIGAKIAALIGADADEVVVCDSVSVNLFKVLASAVAMRPPARDRHQRRQFSDRRLHRGRPVRTTRRQLQAALCSPAHIERALDHDVVAVSFSHVDYKAPALRIWRRSPRRCMPPARSRSGI
jgi:kynureninase